MPSCKFKKSRMRSGLLSGNDPEEQSGPFGEHINEAIGPFPYVPESGKILEDLFGMHNLVSFEHNPMDVLSGQRSGARLRAGARSL